MLDINAVIYGLIYLFYEPNPDDPLNREAADLFRNDRTQVSPLLLVLCVDAMWDGMRDAGLDAILLAAWS